MTVLQDIGWYGLNRLEIWELNETGAFLSRMSVRKANNQLLIDQYEEPAQLPAQISPCLAIILAIRLDNIIEAKMSVDETDVIAKLLGISVQNHDEFIWQINPINEQLQWACLTRKQSLQAIWQSVEPFSGQILYLNLSQLSQTLLLDASPEQDPPAAYRTLCKQLQVPQEALYPYSVGMQFFRLQGQDLHGWEQEQRFGDQLIRNRKWLKSLSVLSTICLFIMSGFLLLQSQINQRIHQAESHIYSQTSIIQKIDSLDQQISKYQHYLGQRLSSSSSQLSYFLDRTAQLAPARLSFQKWIYRPSPAQCKKLSLNKDINPILLIQGTALSSSSISEFARRIQHQFPTYKIDLQHSSYSMQQAQYQFLLMIL